MSFTAALNAEQQSFATRMGLNPAQATMLANAQAATAGGMDWASLSGRFGQGVFGGGATDQMAPRLVTQNRRTGAATATPSGAPEATLPMSRINEKPRLRSQPDRENENFVNIHEDTLVTEGGRSVPLSQLRRDMRAAGKTDDEIRNHLLSEHRISETVDARGNPAGFAIHSAGLTQDSRDAVGRIRQQSQMFAGSDMAMRNMGGMAAGVGLLSFGSAMLGATDGIQFQMRKQMRSVASNFGDYNMLSLINSPGISIESLIYYFMAYMSDKYEDKLREKMEEVVIQEQRERRMQQRRDAAEMVGGILSIGGIFNPVGMAAGMAVKQFGEMINGVEGALSGGSKSTTVLMQEVQILIQNWKMIMDMTSNVSKTLHEMAMTAVRNIR